MASALALRPGRSGRTSVSTRRAAMPASAGAELEDGSASELELGGGEDEGGVPEPGAGESAPRGRRVVRVVALNHDQGLSI